MSSSDGVAQFYSQAPGSLFAALYDSQGYGGDILTRFHVARVYNNYNILFKMQDVQGYKIILILKKKSGFI
jgi:hypothetical protein